LSRNDRTPGTEGEIELKRLFFLFVGFLFLLTACQPAELTPPPTAEPGTLYINPEVDLGPISPLIYGSNHGPWTAVPAGMMDYALDSKVTNLRFPGGEWGDNNDIKDYQIDQFIFFLEQMDAIPTISVRMVDGTPEKAAELVRYCNIEKGYDIKYWSIGNEPTLYEGRPAIDSYDTERHNREWRAIAEAMKAVDPDILLMGPELHGTFTSNFETNPKDSAGRDWMVEFLEANGDMVDIVTYHRYPFPESVSSGSASIEDLRQDLPEWNRTVRYLRDLIQEKTGRDLPIGVTETNSHYTHAVGGEATPDSHYNAIWWADVLGRMIDEDVLIANYFLLAATGSSAGFGMLAPYEVRPTYYIYQMYSHFGDQQIYASSGVEGLNVYAAKDTEGKLTLLIINPADVALESSLNVEGVKLDQAEKWLFDAEHNTENMGTQNISSEAILTFPAQSITLLVITPNGE
jgi:hypothetical protein